MYTCLSFSPKLWHTNFRADAFVSAIPKVSASTPKNWQGGDARGSGDGRGRRSPQERRGKGRGRERGQGRGKERSKDKGQRRMEEEGEREDRGGGRGRRITGNRMKRGDALTHHSTLHLYEKRETTLEIRNLRTRKDGMHAQRARARVATGGEGAHAQ